MSQELRTVLKQEYGLEHLEEITSIEPAVETLEALGNPQETFPSFHVAGTNGKGSTVWFIARILEEAGYDVGLYYGPPVRGYRYRFQVNGEPIDRDRLFSIADDIIDRSDPSLYELSTALGFTFFAEEDVDVAVVEAGIGGRYDATNTLESDVAVFTSVSKDHTDLLGSTREEIAQEHAAIIDAGAEVISNVDDEIEEVFRRKAAEIGARFHAAEQRVRLVPTERLDLDAVYGDRRVTTPIKADYQEHNINAALAALEHSSFSVSEDDVVSVLSSFRFPGRMHQIGERPLTVLDGAHNPGAVRELCRTLDRFDGEITAVFGVMADKDWGRMLQRLDRSVDRFLFTDVAKDRAADPAELADGFGDAPVFDDPVAAVDAAQEAADGDGMVLVTGSLYLCGDVIRDREAGQ